MLSPLIKRRLTRPASLNNYAYGSFTNAGPATALGSALKAWMNVDDHGTAQMTDDGSGVISAWTSHDGSALAVTAATTARPTWTSNAISNPNGKTYAGLTFDGTANCMVTTTLTNVPTGSTAGEIWVIATQASAAATGRRVVTCGDNAAAANRSLGINAAIGPIISDDTTTLSEAVVTPWVASNIRILSGNWSGTTMGGRINGGLTHPASATIGSLNTSTSRVRIGANNAVGAANFWQGVIRHVFFTTTLTLLQRRQLEAWMAWDVGMKNWLLPGSHPFKLQPP